MDRRRDLLPGETLVFVYGTLMSGERNQGLLRGAQCLGEARTAALYVLVDRGDHPGMAAGGTTAVAGELFAVDGPTLERLDAFEAEDDEYRRAVVLLEGGGTADAWLIPAWRAWDLPAILSGSWRVARAERARGRD